MSAIWINQGDMPIRPLEAESACTECGYPGGTHDCPGAEAVDAGVISPNLRLVPGAPNPLHSRWTDVEQQLGHISWAARECFGTHEYERFNKAASRMDDMVNELQSRIDQLRNDWIKEHL